MNSSPHRTLTYNVPLLYKVGQAFWSSFVTIEDYETSFPTVTEFRNHQAAVTAANANGVDAPKMDDAKLDFISIEYSSDESALPDVDSFFRVFASTMASPSLYEIRSGEFTVDHIGTHSINVTVADADGARMSFVLSFTVAAAGTSDGYEKKTDMSDDGYEAYLASILGEEGLESLYEAIAEAE